MPTDAFRTLLSRAHNQFGYLTTADADELGVSQATLRSMASRGQAEHVARGLYRMPDVPSDPRDLYMEAVLRVGGGAVLSHDSALEIYDVCDINPAELHLTVPASYRSKRSFPGHYRLHHEDLPADQVTVLDGLPVVTLRRAIWGTIDNLAGEHVVLQAIERAAELGLLNTSEQQQLNSYKLLRFTGAV